MFPLQTFEQNKLKHEYIRRVQDELGPIKIIIFDEISMVGADKLGTVDQICRLATLKISEIMGGIHFLIAGDFYQLPPVIENYHKPLYKEPVQGDRDMTLYGYNVY